jgi:hypothetical protein
MTRASRPFGRAPRLAIAAALSLVAVACAGSASPTPGTGRGPTVLPPTAPPVDHARIPALADVPEYRGDTARTGIYPGPGPIAQPDLVWSR